MKYWKPFAKRGLALFLVLMMCMTLLPTAALAAENGEEHTHNQDGWQCQWVEPETETACVHTEHDSACGYVEAAEEIPCGCTELDGEGNVVHGDDCAYTPAVEGRDCAHVCGAACVKVVTEGHWDCTAPEEPETEESEESETEESEKSETVVYATVDEFMDAIAAFGDVTDVEENERALDRCDAIYARLSPEDQAAMAEYHEALQAYREDPNGGIEPLAYCNGGSCNLYVGTITVDSDGKQIDYVYPRKTTFYCVNTQNHATNATHGFAWSDINSVGAKYFTRQSPGVNGQKISYSPVPSYGSLQTTNGQTVCLVFVKESHTHNYSSTVTKQPTCTDTGVRTYTCNGSGTCDKKTYTETISALGHVYGTWVDNNSSNSHVTGCTSTQHKQVCTRCKVTLSTEDHTYGEWKTVTEAQPGVAGEKKRTCTASGCGHFETQEIPALPVVSVPVTLTYVDKGGREDFYTWDYNPWKTEEHSSGDQVTLAEPKHQGYVFEGWAESQDGTVAYGPGSTMTIQRDTTLYAKWSDAPGKRYNFTLYYNSPFMSTFKTAGAWPGNRESDTYTFTIQDARQYSNEPAPTYPSHPTEGFNFLGWTTKGAYRLGESNVELRDGDSYTVTATPKDWTSTRSNPYDPNACQVVRNVYAVWECAHDHDEDGYCTDPNCTHPDMKYYEEYNCCPKRSETPAPDLEIVKSAPKGVKAGGSVEYTITVTNNGSADAHNVVVTDTLPEQLGRITDSSPDCGYSKGVYSWDLGTIEAGGFKEITFTAPGKEGVTGSAENTAYVTSDETPDPIPSNTVVTRLYKLTPTKDHNDGIMVDQGTGTATIKYTVTITNESGFDLYGLDIVDTLKKPEITQGEASLRLRPTSLSTTDGSVQTETLEAAFALSGTEATPHTFPALARDVVFRDGSTVTLKYDVIVTNTGAEQLVLRLSNTAKGACWTTDGAESQMFRMAARSGGYDAESEEVGDKAGVGDDATVIIPPPNPDNVTITIRYVDEDGNPIPGADDTKIPVKKDDPYDVTGEISAPDGYAVIEVTGDPQGTADSSKTITVKCGEDTLSDPARDPDPGKSGDGIPDSMQYTVTYQAVGGSVSFGSTVVTKLDGEGKPSADGAAKLTEKHIPDAVPDTANGYEGEGSWRASKPEPGAEITGDTEFTVTFQKTEAPTVTVKDTDGTDKGTWREDPDEDKILTPDGEGKVKLPDENDITPPAGKELDKWKDQNGNEYDPGEEITPDEDLTLEPVWKDITPDAVTAAAAPVTAVYDSLGHSIDPSTVTFKKGGADVTPDAGTSVVITYKDVTGTPVNAGRYTAVITAVIDGREVTVEIPNAVTITQRGLTITTGTASQRYTGSALTNSTWSQSGLVGSDRISVTTTGSQTSVGRSYNTCTYVFTSGLASNYNVTVAAGTLTVTERSTGGGTGGGGTGGGTSRPSGGSGTGTTTIEDIEVPLAGSLQLNKTDHFAYIKGYQDGTVRPNNPLTRAQVATIFYRLLDETSRTIYFRETNDFTDVSDDFWACKAISTLTGAGIITGFQDGTFRPNAYITRAQFAAIAARFDNVVPGLDNPFSDVAEDYWARDLIAFAVDRGWINGEGGKFRPLENITRVEAMDFINNVLDRHVDEKGLLENATTWTDVPVSDPNYYVVEEATNSHDYTRRTEGQLMENWTKLNPDPVWDE